MPSFRSEVPLIDNPQSAEDHFLLGFHDAKDNEALNAMSYVQLCSELELSSAGTTKYMLLEAEKRRRDLHISDKESDAKPNHAAQKSPYPTNDIKHWSDKPLGKVGIGLFIGILVLCAAFLLRHYLALPI